MKTISYQKVSGYIIKTDTGRTYIRIYPDNWLLIGEKTDKFITDEYLLSELEDSFQDVQPKEDE